VGSIPTWGTILEKSVWAKSCNGATAHQHIPRIIVSGTNLRTTIITRNIAGMKVLIQSHKLGVPGAIPGPASNYAEVAQLRRAPA
jgi:hypothetical protein